MQKRSQHNYVARYGTRNYYHFGITLATTATHCCTLLHSIIILCLNKVTVALATTTTLLLLLYVHYCMYTVTLVYTSRVQVGTVLHCYTSNLFHHSTAMLVTHWHIMMEQEMKYWNRLEVCVCAVFLW